MEQSVETEFGIPSAQFFCVSLLKIGTICWRNCVKMNVSKQAHIDVLLFWQKKIT